MNNIAFAGTPEFAAAVLQAMLRSAYAPQLVLTQPDRRSGRGRKLVPSPVKALAVAHGIAVMQPPGLRTAESLERLREARLDVLVVAAYGLLIPPEILSLPRHGCINVHASLLPRWRGASPVQAAILAGDETTGVTIMQMDEGLDTGAMLLQAPCPIAADETTASLTGKLATLGADTLLKTLRQLPALVALPQDDADATYAPRISKAQGELDFRRDARALERQVRAFTPWPGSHTTVDGERLRVLRAHLGQAAAAARPGEVVQTGSDGIDVATGDGTLRLTRVQRAGGKPVDARDFLHARPLHPGTVLGTQDG